MTLHRLLPAAALLAATVPSLAATSVPPAIRNEAGALAQLCRADYERLCPGIRPGGGRILVCLQRQAPQLSPACAQAMPRAQALKQKAKVAGVLPN